MVVGQAIVFCRLSSAGSGRPQKAMACPTLRLPMSHYLCAPTWKPVFRASDLTAVSAHTQDQIVGTTAKIRIP